VLELAEVPLGHVEGRVRRVQEELGEVHVEAEEAAVVAEEAEVEVEEDAGAEEVVRLLPFEGGMME